MILNDLLIELKRIATALEKLANIESLPKQELPKDSKFELLDEDRDLESIIDKQLEEGRKAGFMFPEDAVDLELLEGL